MRTHSWERIKESGRPFLLHGGRIARGASDPVAADILISQDGRIVRIADRIETDPETFHVDISGALVSPGFVDMHQHLDKTGVLKFTSNPSGTLQGARDAFAKYARTAPPEDVSRRASRTMARCLARGTSAIRSHVNVDKDAGFKGIEALAELRSQWADRMTLQLVAFMTPHPNQDLAWLAENIDAAVSQADAVGGTPAVAEDPMRYLDIIFEAAVRHGRQVDLHLDEHLNPERPLFDAVFDRVRKYGMQGRTIVGHASVLSALPRGESERIRDRMLELDIGVVTLPAANLYLQGRNHDMLPPRGLTRVAELLHAGVRIATASDNISDPFIPTGSGDMLEMARWTLLAGHLRSGDLGTAYEMITSIPAGLIGLGTDYGLREGAWADLVISDCDEVAALVGQGPDRMQVLARGKPVPRDAELQCAEVRATAETG